MSDKLGLTRKDLKEPLYSMCNFSSISNRVSAILGKKVESKVAAKERRLWLLRIVNSYAS